MHPLHSGIGGGAPTRGEMRAQLSTTGVQIEGRSGCLLVLARPSVERHGFRIASAGVLGLGFGARRGHTSFFFIRWATQALRETDSTE